ncbi:MAG: hypothetical protein ACJA2D_002922 [Pseudohongiellaceae bacterium]
MGSLRKLLKAVNQCVHLLLSPDANAQVVFQTINPILISQDDAVLAKPIKNLFAVLKTN